MQKRLLFILFVTIFIDAIGFAMLAPIIPIIFFDVSSPDFLLAAYSDQARYLIAGIVLALYGIVQFFAAPLLGELSDVYGRKRLLMVGVAVLALSQVSFGLGIAAGSLVLLFISRVVGGLGAANFSIAQAAIADVTEPKDRAKNFGLIGAAFGLAFMVGPAIAGYVAGITGDASSPFWIAAGLGVLNLLSVAFFMPETHVVSSEEKRTFSFFKGIRNIRDALFNTGTRLIYLSNLLYLCAFAFMTSFFGILLVNKFMLTETDIGIFFSVVGIWIALTQLVLLRFVTRFFSERKILFVALPIIAVALALHPFMANSMWLFVIIPIYSIPHALAMATMPALVSKAVPGDKQGAALGINGSLMAFSQGIIPIVAGTVTALIGLTAPFVIGGLFVVASWLVLFVFSRRAV
ncbi:MFS transporter [Patescibacteria group bacterium]|nr:MFS transporter [Patescibacteria group bacterium]